MKTLKYKSRADVFMAGALFLLGATSCEKELDFEYHDIAPIPVIEASVTQEGAEVTITETTPMDKLLDSTRLTDATVTLLDLTSGDMIALQPDADGAFRSHAAGIPGHDYRLTVEREGATYRATARMLSPVEISDVEFVWVSMPGDDMAVLRILFTDNPLYADNYWVRVYRNGEAYAWSVLTDHAQTDGMMEEAITTTHRDESKEEDEKQLLLDGDEVRVSVTPISRDMREYLTGLMNGSNGITQFEGDFCLGYFLPSPVASRTITYHPDEIEYAH